MMRWICAAVLALGVAPTVGAEYKDCPMKMLAAVDVRVDDDGTVLVPVDIEGHQVWMALALESGLPTLYSAAVDGWNLKARRRHAT